MPEVIFAEVNKAIRKGSKRDPLLRESTLVVIGMGESGIPRISIGGTGLMGPEARAQARSRLEDAMQLVRTSRATFAAAVGRRNYTEQLTRLSAALEAQSETKGTCVLIFIWGKLILVCRGGKSHYVRTKYWPALTEVSKALQ